MKALLLAPSRVTSPVGLVRGVWRVEGGGLGVEGLRGLRRVHAMMHDGTAVPEQLFRHEAVLRFRAEGLPT